MATGGIHFDFELGGQESGQGNPMHLFLADPES